MVRWSFIVLAGCGFSNAADAPLDASIDGTATTIELAATADTFLRAMFPDSSYGDDYYQRCGSGNPGHLTNRAIYRFALSALPCDVAKAELRAYYFDQDYNRSPTLSAFRMTAEWSEADATWNERDIGVAWTTPGGDFGAAPLASVVAPSGAYGWLAWDVTAAAVAWRDGEPNYGVIIIEPNDTSGALEGRKFFYTRDARTAANRPHLRITCE